MNIDELKAKREKLQSRIKTIDAQIAKIEREQREREQRELLKLIQSRGLTASQLAQLLDSAANGETK